MAKPLPLKTTAVGSNKHLPLARSRVAAVAALTGGFVAPRIL